MDKWDAHKQRIVSRNSIASIPNPTYNKTGGNMTTPESRARQNIDSQLANCDWVVQDRYGQAQEMSSGVNANIPEVEVIIDECHQ